MWQYFIFLNQNSRGISYESCHLIPRTENSTSAQSRNLLCQGTKCFRGDFQDPEMLIISIVLSLILPFLALLFSEFVLLSGSAGGGLVTKSTKSDSCDTKDCIPPGSSVHGILQARVQEWVAIPFSRASSQPRVQPAGGFFFYHWATGEAQKPRAMPEQGLKTD